MWACVLSGAIDLFEVVTLIAVALFLLVGVVVAAIRPAPLLGLFFGRLRPPACLSALATCVTLWTEVCATWGHVTAATPPALSLVLGLGLLRRSRFDCSVPLFVQRKREGKQKEQGQLATKLWQLWYSRTLQELKRQEVTNSGRDRM